MTYTGVVENGVVKLPANWKDGTAVQVESVELAAPPKNLAEKLIELSRKVKGLPRHLAENHDEFLHRSGERRQWLLQLSEMRKRMATGKTTLSSEQILDDLRSDRD